MQYEEKMYKIGSNKICLSNKVNKNNMEFIYRVIPFFLPRLKFLKKVSGTRYLDVGCGDGLVLRQNFAVRPNLEFFAVDIKDFSEQLPKYVSFTIYNGSKLPYHDDFFDIVTVNHVIEHIPNVKNILAEFKRVIKKSGRIYIEMPNKRSLWGRTNNKCAGTINFFDDSTHLRPYSISEISQLSRDCGLKVIKSGIARNYLHLILSPFLLLVGVLMTKLFYYMYGRNSIIGWSSYVILQK